MKMSFTILYLLLLTACAIRPRGSFEPPVRSVDYSDPVNWAALPDRFDTADLLPAESLTDRQDTSPADVFFIYPTIYWSERGDTDWNAPLSPEMNARIDSSAIKNQATVFNGAGRVYAPYYRQAHIRAYREKSDTTSARRAFELAYADVRASFEYYLEHYNEGRPFIIAAHSQGTTHSKQLVRELIDGTPLQERLIAAYLVGIAVPPGYFREIPVCERPEQTGCFVSWRTYREGATPEFQPRPGDAVVVNPLSWTTQEEFVPRTQNKGAVLRDFYKGLYPNVVGAQVSGSVLYTDKPKFPGSAFFWRKNYHIADYNFFWKSVRDNAWLRVQSYAGK